MADRPQDVGGSTAFGPVPVAAAGAELPADWRGRTFALELIVELEELYDAHWFRAGIEAMPRAEYFAAEYYARWLRSLEANLARVGPPAGSPVPAAELLRMIREGFGPGEPAVDARFAVGEAVRARVLPDAAHARIPRYAQGRRGVVERVNARQVVPDSSLEGAPVAEPVYTVAFDAAELWGPGAEPGSVRTDLWERYLEDAA